jgi:hypothetical protein
MGENLDTWPQSVGSDARPLAEIAACAEIASLHMTTSRAVLAAIYSNASKLLPHFKIDLVALGMVEKDLRPLKATAAPLA